MLLSEEEFYSNKEIIVKEVLDKLRTLAMMEAELLFREFDSYEGSLPELSQVVSNTINKATDAIAEAIDSLSIEERNSMLPLVRSHLPKTIADLSFDRINDNVPEQYIKNAMASCLASKLVYKEGTQFVESQPRKKLAKFSLEYLKRENDVAVLAQKLQESNMSEVEKTEILELLLAGGARTAVSAGLLRKSQQ